MAMATERIMDSKESTEIRCQEKTRGGLRYEVILSEPTTPVKPVPSISPTSPNSNSNQIFTFEKKMREAEERRQSIEAGKMAALAAKLGKIEEVIKKKDELNANFVAATRESLDAKMDNVGAKREAYITDIKAKVKEHLEAVEKSRVSLEQQTEEVRKAVEEKLKIAAAQRDENTKKMIERLKDHEEQVSRVRQGITDRVQQLDIHIQRKMDQARERRESIEREQIEKLRKYDKKVEMVRLNKAKVQSKDGEDNETPISG